MKKTVLVCGWDGYLGYALTLRLLTRGYKVIGIDDFSRRENVKLMDSFSAVEIDDPEKRVEILKGVGNFIAYTHSLHKDYDVLCEMLSNNVPDVIVNLAQQPSAPFSLRSRKDAEETSISNLIGTLNMLYFIKEFNKDAHLIQIGSMGEYDPAMGTDIPEGTFDLQLNNKIARNVIFPRRPGSFYHASKVAATYYMDCACRWWGLRATDIMQGVVYGNWTPELEKYKTNTRLDSDECFGTVLNRFIVQAVVGEPLTVYGDGMQSRGYLSITDSIQCLMLAIENPPKKGDYRTWNQLDDIWNIVSLAGAVVFNAKKFGLTVKVENIPTPRAEATHGFEYTPYVDKLLALGFRPTRTVDEEIRYLLSKLIPIAESELYPLRNVVTPKITWR
jgi:nucleoside-diphosphate-sugar epimerase